uniref:Uncharacterized protein n=1 Tax=Setaria viridis TaxID=4556 RepID=A0A4V6D550_SETVI|nr:hypothetical protein SEVIR_9G417300v2 [Setaria viridis]
MKPIAVRNQQPPEEKLTHSEETCSFFVRHSINSCYRKDAVLFLLAPSDPRKFNSQPPDCCFLVPFRSISDPTPYKLFQQTPRSYMIMINSCIHYPCHTLHHHPTRV